MKVYDYANILFSGNACNLRCYDCIGKSPLLGVLPDNLQKYPLQNIDTLLDACVNYAIPDLAFTGTNVDPQLYAYEKKLIEYSKEVIKAKQGISKLSLHTNGRLALKKINEFNMYDKASISLPSFNNDTYTRITGAREILPIEEILGQATIPVKLSMIITPFNISEISQYIENCENLGIKRVVIRKLKGREAEYPIETKEPFKDKIPIKRIFDWPVYDFSGIEVTICSFEKSTARGIFLFSDGTIKDELGA